jgi:diguanylate cyclase (GGDEF)-like protein/PAS domain S-box-containing protein
MGPDVQPTQTEPLATDHGRGRRVQAIPTLFGLGLLASAIVVALALVGAGSAFIDSFTVAAGLAAAAVVLSSAWRLPHGERAPWLILGLAICSYSFGSLLHYFFLGPHTDFPNSADLAWLAFYPLFVAALVTLLRGRGRDDRVGLSLDAATIAVAIAAIAYEVLFNALIDFGAASELAGGQLAYPILDFGLLAVIVVICLPSRARVGKAYLALGAGLAILLISDVLAVRQMSADTYAAGTLLDAAAPAAMLLLALGSRLDSRLPDVKPLRGGVFYAAIIGSFLLAFALLITEMLGDRDPVVIVLAALVPCLILIRLVAALRANERLAKDNEGIVGAAGEGIVRIDRRGRMTYANPAALEMLGYTREEALGQRSHELFHHTRVNGLSYPAAESAIGRTLSEGVTSRITDEVFWRKDGSSFAVDYTTSPVRESGHIVGAVTVFDDVTHQRQLEDQLRHQADHDSLTGLFNRRRFEAEVSEQIEYARRYEHSGAVMLIDLDTFTFVNDSYGHPSGDRVLSDVAARLGAMVGSTDVVARMGGDEFAVLLREAGEEEAVEIAKELIAAIRTASKPTVGASIGIALFDGAVERTPDELVIGADIALYEAKELGGGATVLYTGQSSQALTWVDRIRAALDQGRLVVYAQPIVEIESGLVAREELLVRMLDPHGDKIPPASFLPAAERFGLIREIDLMVLTRAIELAGGGTRVAVNVSARTLTDARYAAALEGALATGLDPECFNFEITETAAVGNMSDAQEFARRIGELGCSLSLDDFGTGFSSFTYLKHIPAQYLKIDMEFIRELKKNPADQRLVEAMVSIARGLGQKTVAEGVQDADTLATVRRLGVDYAQGFHLGEPRPTSVTGDGSSSTEPSPDQWMNSARST